LIQSSYENVVAFFKSRLAETSLAGLYEILL